MGEHPLADGTVRELQHMSLFSRVRRLFGGETPERAFVTAVVLAGGSGTRMGAGEGKLMIELAGRPILFHTLEAFERARLVDEVVVAAREQDLLAVSDLVVEWGLVKTKKIVCGGATRQQSMQAGLGEADERCRLVAVHDGARPFVRPEQIDAVVAQALRTGAAALGVPVKDTLKRVGADGRIRATVDRAELYAIQTPQAFGFDELKTALAVAQREELDFTDDCQLFEKMNWPVSVVPGDYDNIKITTPADLAVGEAILERRAWGDEDRTRV
ncbi:2-C-methyl-D-erythritol 4-phosphate cytidylyltransferase [Feifania hominis]|nr:2-C-methyl-D-erythritol 4-phosphate cytidylyltransferase [Feifania hominis]